MTMPGAPSGSDVSSDPPLEVEIPEGLEEFTPGERSISEKQERIRGVLALIFAILFVAVIVTPVPFVWINGVAGWVAIKEWLQVILPPLTAIVGAAMGFYFGTRSTSP